MLILTERKAHGLQLDIGLTSQFGTSTIKNTRPSCYKFYKKVMPMLF